MKKVIHIYGASGSGTSTLGKKICDETGYFFMDTDDYYWLPVEPKYTQKRAIEERLTLMKRDIEKHDNVVISGSLVGWGDELIPYFSLAVRLVTDSSVRIERLRKREKAEFGDSILPGGERYEEFSAFIEWASQYDTGDLNIRSKAYHDEWEKLLNCKKIVLNGEDTPDYNYQKIMGEIMNVLVETERLLITEMTMDMVMDVHKNSLDEDTRRFVPDEVFETIEDAKETVEFLISQYGSAEGPLVYAVILKDGSKNIGYVQLVSIGEGKWEIGYHVAKQYTCKGYATEAVTAFLPIMAKKVGIEEVYGIRLLENVASGRVLDKCGFESFFKGEGEYHDGVYEISKSVWKL